MGEDKIRYLRKKYPHYKAYQYLCQFSGETPKETEEWLEHERLLMEKFEMVRTPGGYEYRNSTYLVWAKAYEQIIDNTAKEIRDTPWWRFKRQQYLRSRLRWATYHHSKSLKLTKVEL